jgi:hypothetical protein
MGGDAYSANNDIATAVRRTMSSVCELDRVKDYVAIDATHCKLR